MGSAVLAVRYQGFGQEWTTTHGISMGSREGAMTAAEMTSVRDLEPPEGYTDVNTDFTNSSYPVDPAIIQSILAFSRQALSQDCQIIGFNLSDGATPGAPSGPFWSQNFSLGGMYGVALAALVPLSIAWLIGRVPSAIATRTGHMNLRAALAKADVEPGGKVGVIWSNEAARASHVTRINALVAQSHLDDYFGPGAEASPEYVIPVYAVAQAVNAGQVINGHPVSSLTSINPTSRQKPRGRKRAAA